MNVLQIARKKFSEFILGQTNNISRLMTDKLDDFVLLQEAPFPVIVGNKIIYIGTFNYDTELKFFKKWSAILSNLAARIIKMDLANERRKELLEKGDFFLLANGKYLKEFLLMDKRLKKDMCRLLRDTVLKQQMYVMLENQDKREIIKWRNCSYRYFKKWITSELLIQMAYMVYMYNFDSQKKSLKVIMARFNLKSLEETYIPFWLKNLPGLIGKFEHVQVPSIDAYSKEQENEKSLTKHYQEVKNDN